MSTNSTLAGTWRLGFTMEATCDRRGSGISATPTLGSMVVKGVTCNQGIGAGSAR